jgi:hypothetical protein
MVSNLEHLFCQPPRQGLSPQRTSTQPLIPPLKQVGFTGRFINLQNLQISDPRRKRTGYYGILPLRVRFCPSVEPRGKPRGILDE